MLKEFCALFVVGDKLFEGQLVVLHGLDEFFEVTERFFKSGSFWGSRFPGHGDKIVLVAPVIDRHSGPIHQEGSVEIGIMRIAGQD